MLAAHMARQIRQAEPELGSSVSRARREREKEKGQLLSPCCFESVAAAAAAAAAATSTRGSTNSADKPTADTYTRLQSQTGFDTSRNNKVPL